MGEGDAFCRRCGYELPAGDAPASGAPSRETGEGETAWVPAGEAASGAEETPAGAEPPDAGLVPPVPPATPPLPYPPPPTPRTAAAASSGLAVSSLVTGILSFLCLPFIAGVAAIVLGIIARRDIRRSGGETSGSGMATAGIVLGTANLALLLVLAAAVVPWVIINLGRTQVVTRTVGAQGAQHVAASLEMENGSLEVGGGAGEMFEGTFTYNVRRWEPEIDYSVRQGEGELGVRQGGEWWMPAFWFIRNDWDIRFSDGVPLDLTARLSSGDADLDLKSLALRSLSVDTSSGDVYADLSGDMPELRRVSAKVSSGDVAMVLAGKYGTYIQMDVATSSGGVDLDLRGEWESALGCTVSTSSGDVTLRLPQSVGVRVRVETRSGEVRASGLVEESRDSGGTLYVNGAFRLSPITLQIDVEVSSGDVTLLSD